MSDYNENWSKKVEFHYRTQPPSYNQHFHGEPDAIHHIYERRENRERFSPNNNIFGPENSNYRSVYYEPMYSQNSKNNTSNHNNNPNNSTNNNIFNSSNMNNMSQVPSPGNFGGGGGGQNTQNQQNNPGNNNNPQNPQGGPGGHGYSSENLIF